MTTQINPVCIKYLSSQDPPTQSCLTYPSPLTGFRCGEKGREQLVPALSSVGHEARRWITLLQCFFGDDTRDDTRTDQGAIAKVLAEIRLTKKDHTFSDVPARLGSGELPARKIPTSCDAWRPPKHRKKNSEKINLLWVSQISF